MPLSIWSDRQCDEYDVIPNTTRLVDLETSFFCIFSSSFDTECHCRCCFRCFGFSFTLDRIFIIPFHLCIFLKLQPFSFFRVFFTLSFSLSRLHCVTRWTIKIFVDRHRVFKTPHQCLLFYTPFWMMVALLIHINAFKLTFACVICFPFFNPLSLQF